MSFGYDKQQKVFIGDSATLRAFLYDDQDNPVESGDITSVTFTVYAPDGSIALDAVSGTHGSPEENEGWYVVDGALITQPGEWRGMAQFTYTDVNLSQTLKRSVPVFFDAIDPFKGTDPTPADGAISMAWEKLEDCFDSEFGGPWLRDMSLSNFDKNKIKDFIPDVLLEINAVMPQTNYTVDDFPWTMDDGQAIFGWGLLLAAIRHLMRSYTEQPDQSSSPVPHMDRTRYQQAWSVIYQVEKERYDELLRLFKVRSFANNRASLLIGTKAGRLLPGAMRARNVGRGYYKYLDIGSSNQYHEYYEDMHEVQ